MRIRAIVVSILLAVMLVACVGSSSLQLATGGIGGTGIAAGPITGFGSIFVNGVEYDIDAATLTRNGQPATGQHEYRIGEYVVVKGTVNPDGLTGTATEVSFSNELEGTVTAETTDGVDIEIMGQVIRTNTLTVSHGFTQLAELGIGNVVEVSGVRDGQDVLQAASMTLKQRSYVPGTETELKGLVRQLDALNKTFQIGNLTVDYTQAMLDGFGTTPLVNGQYVEAKTQQALQGNRMQAYSIELENEYDHFDNGTQIELHGVVTRFVSIADFSVNRQAVVTTATTDFEDGAASALRLNALVEVDGQINAQGVLVADEVSVKDSGF
ncbi:DUF5666 domain-containing protein [Thiothrix lacustris]|uniref:DUF5666 domain-containing protein n=1 Tax=Thiothrix lacustris TaxID=525917 RepID=UPI0027E50824|nr:DUF5666 domain-containing protein [Thiothrix lacustris]WMP18740.1 DUF5666 domain-containing protein [Thiothrix lacustris]